MSHPPLHQASILQRFNSAKISSTVVVRDGETIALGGLIRDSRSLTRTGVPYLRRIPLLGDLFSSTDKGSRRTELIVLLTPRIIRSDQDSAAIMTEPGEQFRGLRKIMPEWRLPSDGPAVETDKSKRPRSAPQDSAPPD